MIIFMLKSVYPVVTVYLDGSVMMAVVYTSLVFLTTLLTVTSRGPAVSPLSSNSDDPVVNTTLGPVRGLRTSMARVFKGIPYARPPLGELRWRPPQAAIPWGPAVKNVTIDAAGCPQSHCADTTPPFACPTKISEDCLTLNIFTPLGAKNGSDLAVMVFIHGGNFFTLFASSPVFDGQVFVSRGNVVLVNINYRLGALGFLVTGQSNTSATGNYGLFDQRFALEWIKNNVRNFGGDPNKITLFGQSAGAQSVLHHMTSDTVSAYFRSAILESTPISLPYKNFDEAFVLGGLLAEQLHCPISDLTCLRSKSAQDVASAAYRTRQQVASLKFLEAFEPYGPWIDGVEVKGQPFDVYNSGQFHQKPLIIGTTSEETVLYIYSAFNSSVGLAKYLEILLAARPSKVAEIIERYPPTATTTDQREVLVNISTDLVMLCPSNNVTRTFLRKSSPVWSYVWDHAFSFPGWGPIKFCEGRVCHGTELAYVFDTAYRANFTMTADETQLSHNVITYWTNFAWFGDPNTPPPSKLGQPEVGSQNPDAPGRRHQGSARSGQRQTVDFFNHIEIIPMDGFRHVDKLPKWPQYGPANQWAKMWFETPTSKITSNYKKEKCDFWDSIGYGV